MLIKLIFGKHVFCSWMFRVKNLSQCNNQWAFSEIFFVISWQNKYSNSTSIYWPITVYFVFNFHYCKKQFTDFYILLAMYLQISVFSRKMLGNKNRQHISDKCCTQWKSVNLAKAVVYNTIFYFIFLSIKRKKKQNCGI